MNYRKHGSIIGNHITSERNFDRDLDGGYSKCCRKPDYEEVYVCRNKDTIQYDRPCDSCQDRTICESSGIREEEVCLSCGFVRNGGKRFKFNFDDLKEKRKADITNTEIY